MRICIYTAIYGGYDSLKPQPIQDLPADFVCFSDDALDAPAPWKLIRDRRLSHLHPRLQAKWHKTQPHRMFRRQPSLAAWRSLFHLYTHTVWIDGSVQLTSPDFARVVAAAAEPSGWAMFAHPRRDCIYDELQFSLSMPKYKDQPMVAQVNHYRAEGIPEHIGLMAGGIIARKTNCPEIDAAGEEWWRENLQWSYQDQLSLPVVLRRHGIRWSVIPGNLWQNDLFVVRHHCRED